MTLFRRIRIEQNVSSTYHESDVWEFDPAHQSWKDAEKTEDPVLIKQAIAKDRKFLEALASSPLWAGYLCLSAIDLLPSARRPKIVMDSLRPGFPAAKLTERSRIWTDVRVVSLSENLPIRTSRRAHRKILDVHGLCSSQILCKHLSTLLFSGLHHA